jgi:hypothetical protein
MAVYYVLQDGQRLSQEEYVVWLEKTAKPTEEKATTAPTNPISQPGITSISQPAPVLPTA